MSDIIKEAPKAGYTVALVSRSWNGKRTLKRRGFSLSREEANQICAQWKKDHDGWYKVFGPRQLADELKRMKASSKQKAAATRAKNKREGAKPVFIHCPSCGARSKKLRSEFGGLQTRVCVYGHYFEYDKWIADRAFWNPAAVLSVYKTL